MNRSLLCALLLLSWAGWLLAALCAEVDQAGSDRAASECAPLYAASTDAADSNADSPAQKTACASPQPDHTQQPDGAAVIDPLGPNAACYVCHITFVHEELSTGHQAKKVTCVTCHGLSAGHANDEKIGATPPDVRYARGQIDAACRKCHEHHNVPAREVLVRFLERKLPARAEPVCTDCHGRHRIAAAKGDSPAASQSRAWSKRSPLARAPRSQASSGNEVKAALPRGFAVR